MRFMEISREELPSRVEELRRDGWAVHEDPEEYVLSGWWID